MSEQGYDFIEDIPYRQGCTFGRAVPRHSTDARNYVGGAMRVGDNASHQQARFRQVRFATIEPTQSRFAIGRDRPKGLIDLMRDRRC